MKTLYNFDRLSESTSALYTDYIRLMSYDLPQNYQNDYKSYDAPRLCTILNGSKEIAINNSEHFTYNSDGFILLPPHSKVDMYMPELTRAIVYELLKMDACNYIINSQHRHPIYKAIKQFNEYPQKISSIMEIAYDLNMSPSNFTQQFKSVTGMKPLEYLTFAKLKKARTLLHEMAVTEVAYELGYQNISHFIKLFKIQNGITPKQYQLKNEILL